MRNATASPFVSAAAAEQPGEFVTDMDDATVATLMGVSR
jgi:hypothetical protein